MNLKKKGDFLHFIFITLYFYSLYLNFVTLHFYSLYLSFITLYFYSLYLNFVLNTTDIWFSKVNVLCIFLSSFFVHI